MDLDAVWGGEWGRSKDECIAWGGNRRMGHLIVTNGILCVRGGDGALPKLLRDFLFLLRTTNLSILKSLLDNPTQDF